ncbi:MAG: hypothetical protein ACLR1L_08910 [Subdoligranulum sp.]
MLDKTSSIICAFGLASAAPRSPYRHLELCGIALKRKIRTPSAENQHLARLFEIFFVNTLDRAWFIRYYNKCVS